MEGNETNEGRCYHHFLIRVSNETIIELQNCGFQFETCLVWKKRVLNGELESGEISLDYTKGYPELVFKRRKNSVEHFDGYLGDNEKKIVDFFLEEGFGD